MTNLNNFKRTSVQKFEQKIRLSLYFKFKFKLESTEMYEKIKHKLEPRIYCMHCKRFANCTIRLS